MTGNATFNEKWGARRLRHGEEPPYKRVGVCCGKRCVMSAHRRGRPDVPLFRIDGIFRYRCRSCFRRETGYFP